MRRPAISRGFPRASRPEALFNIILPVGLAVLAFVGMIGQDGDDDDGGGASARCSEDPARLESPTSLAVDPEGSVLVVQDYAHCVSLLPGDGNRPAWPCTTAASMSPRASSAWSG